MSIHSTLPVTDTAPKRGASQSAETESSGVSFFATLTEATIARRPVKATGADEVSEHSAAAHDELSPSQATDDVSEEIDLAGAETIPGAVTTQLPLPVPHTRPLGLIEAYVAPAPAGSIATDKTIHLEALVPGQLDRQSLSGDQGKLEVDLRMQRTRGDGAVSDTHRRGQKAIDASAPAPSFRAQHADASQAAAQGLAVKSVNARTSTTGLRGSAAGADKSLGVSSVGQLGVDTITDETNPQTKPLDTKAFMQTLDQSAALLRHYGSKPSTTAQSENAAITAQTPDQLQAFMGAEARGHVLSPISAGAAPLAAQLSIPVPVGAASWGQAMSEQVAGMARTSGKEQQVAHLRLDPPELGPLRVSIVVSAGVAHASFGSNHAAVRQAIESALPDLAQALGDAGLSLGHTDVGEHAGDQTPFSWQDGSQRSDVRVVQSSVSASAAESIQSPQNPSQKQKAQGLVNTFA